jgi:hypothetical protein
MFSAVDSSARNLFLGQRRAWERGAKEKLDLLRRLQARFVECRLPSQAETRIEQSFNEQFFIHILDYSTLFSHRTLPFHLRPKSYRLGRYDDFSLGFFAGAEDESVLASAELKGPSYDLDAHQTDRRDALTPVEQALRTGRLHPSCKWVLVSNFRELRLYPCVENAQPIAIVDLHEVRDVGQLAFLRAHFDREALLGIRGKEHMTIALDANHPSAVIPARARCHRRVLLFTPSQPTDFRMFRLYDALIEAMKKPSAGEDEDEERDRPNIAVSDGWCVVRSENAWIAASALGQIQLSCSVQRGDANDTQVNPDARFFNVAREVRSFFELVSKIYTSMALPKEYVVGNLSVDLRDILNWSFSLRQNEALLGRHETNYGITRTDSVTSGDLHPQVGRDDGCAMLVARLHERVGIPVLGQGWISYSVRSRRVSCSYEDGLRRVVRSPRQGKSKRHPP